LTQAQKLLPGNNALDLVAAKLEIQDRRFDQARKILERLMDSGNQVEQAGLWLGRVEEATGNYPQAIKDYQIAAGVNDRNWQTLNDMAYCMIMDGRTDEALKYAQQAKELVPNNLEVIDTLGWAYFNKGLYDSAVKELAPLADAPRAVERYHLAMAYFKAGDVVRGQTVLRSALKIDAKIPEALVAQEMARATFLMSR
jgi:tetratricopeptide (TPR) repeat protein